MTAEDIAELATRLADSGRRLSWPSAPPVADLASTGGPGSLSTLLVPLLLRRSGCRVVKLAVPGRPAGGIDVLSTIDGYSTTLDEASVRRIVDECGYVHFLADDQFAPTDAALFSYRREVGAVAVPPLAAASLLSKKIAVGVQVVGLDVRVGMHGNFGATVDEARVYARQFCCAARLVGINAVAFLHSATGPEQPWIGRGEALTALSLVLDGLADGSLATHTARCAAMAREVGTLVGMTAGGGDSELLETFAMHLKAQGASLDAFRRRIDEVARMSRRPIRAAADGALTVQLSFLRDALVRAQREVETGPHHRGGFSDPAGVMLGYNDGDAVRAGDVVAEMRLAVQSDSDWIKQVEAAFDVSTVGTPRTHGAPVEVVHA